MNGAEMLIVIFVFGVAMSFLVAKGIWEAKEYHQKEIERERLNASGNGPSKGIKSEPAISR